MAAVAWDGGGDGTSWTNPLNWSGDVLPGATDDVTISVATNPTVVLSSGTHSIHSLVCDENVSLNGGTLDLAAASTITSTFTLQGATLTGAGDLTIPGTFNWHSGILSGTGRAILPAGSAWNLTGEDVFLRRALDHASTTTLSNVGRLHLLNATLNNLAGAVLTVSSDGLGWLGRSDGGTNALVNLGTLNKTGAGVLTVFSPLNNAGALDVQQGALAWNAGGSQAGTLDVSGGAASDFNSTVAFPAGMTLAGPGTLRFLAGTQTFDQPVTFPGVVTLQGATLTGAGRWWQRLTSGPDAGRPPRARLERSIGGSFLPWGRAAAHTSRLL